jgi:chromosome partitioning protein
LPNERAGVGKTTIAICVAAELARRGHPVVLVDGDPQRSACQWAEPGNLEFPVYEIGLAPDQPVAGWARDVRKIKAEIVVIDTAPTEREMGASAALADIILVPCTASRLDIEATERTLGIIEAVRKRRSEPMKVVLVPNRIDRRWRAVSSLKSWSSLAKRSPLPSPIGPPMYAALRQANRLQHLPLRSRRTSRFAPWPTLWKRTCVTPPPRGNKFKTFLGGEAEIRFWRVWCRFLTGNRSLPC